MRSIETDELNAAIRAATEGPTVVETAAEWFLRARERPLTPGEERALARWFRQSPRHIAEFIRMYQLHGLLREAKLQPFHAEPEDAIEAARSADRATAAFSVRRWALWLCGVALAVICVLLLIARLSVA